jgi:ATP-dependent Clp endopeptidase proteolytic subunit ClpP
MKLLQIENRAGKLKLNDGVHKESADKLIEELDSLYGNKAVAAQMVIGEAVCSADNALESVEVEINSPGGSVFEGQRIYNALRGMSERGVAVTTTVNGLAASMGSVILMAGDKKQMTHGSRIMIHEASTIAWGDARTMRKQADLLEGISSEIAGIYADRTGGDEKKIRNLMFAETWMTADEAKENGFVDTVLKDGKAKAEFDTAEKGNMSILAKLFPGNDQVAQLEASLAEADTLRADLEAAQARVGELTPLAEVNAQLQADLADVQAKLDAADTLANENAQAIADLTEKATVTDEKVSLKAAELLATQGHPNPVNLTGDDGNTGTDHIAELAKLQGAERTAYYNEHKAEIRKSLTKS